MKPPPSSKLPSSSPVIHDIWQQQAMTDAIVAMRKVLDDTFPPGTPISRLGEHEFGWLACAAIFAWIKSRSEQAVSEGWNMEETLCATGMSPEPWDAGCVASILPQLADLPDLDWNKPIGAWAKDEIIRFLLKATKLVATAMVARNAGGGVSDPRSRAGPGMTYTLDALREDLGESEIPF